MNQFITQHLPAIVPVVMYVSHAAVATMPKPGDPRPVQTKLYEWFYDFLSVLANQSTKPKLGQPPDPTQAPKVAGQFL